VTRSIPVGQVRWCGDRALLIGVEDAAAGRALRDRLAVALGVDPVVGLATVLVVADDPADVERVSAVVLDSLGQPPGPVVSVPTGAPITIECRFDGPDLDQVAAQSGLAVDQVVHLLVSAPLSVAMVGFSPGFAFLGGLPEPLRHVGRRPRPRPAVPAGSLALANGYAAVYPSASPGGWQLMGRTAATLFSPAEPPFARLAPGDRVQLIAAPGDVAAPAGWVMPAWAPPDGVRQVFTVLRPGLRTVLQDAGRRGAAALGVPTAGPADSGSLGLANRLVGNPAGATALEVTAQGPTLRVEAPGYVALVGATPRVRLDATEVPASRVVPVGTGQELVIDAVHPGLRTYLAVAGGLVGPSFLDSTASDQLSGLGPGPLRAGDPVYAATLTLPLGDHLDTDVVPSASGAIPLRVVAGPHHEWFEPDALDRLAAATFEVDKASNRVGLRLEAVIGWSALRSADRVGAELESQGMVDGALQVPPEGAPIVLLPDHATHGGYPVVAVVAAVDQGRLGQLAPGDRVTFMPIELDQARQLAGEQGHRLERAVVGHYPVAVD